MTKVNIEAQVHSSAALLPSQIPANEFGRAIDDGPSASC